jgi:hypothetical protein
MKSISDQVRAQVRGQVEYRCGKLGYQVWNQVLNPLGCQVLEQVQVWDQVSGQVWIQVKNEIN